MMYWVRFAMLSVSVLFLTYIVSSGVLALAWRWLRTRHRIESANTLYTLRTLPALMGLLVVILITIPSFWSLEPLATDEGVAWPIATLFVASGLWAVFRSARILSAVRKSSRFFAGSSPSSLPLGVTPQVSAYELADRAPNLFVAGLWRPRLYISRGAMQMLDAEELQAAIRHELAHAEGFDNLKQLVVRFCAFPALASLEKEWLRAAEIAADDRAAQNESQAADLASALIKVGTATARLSLPELGMSLVPETDAPVSDRVRRLLEWKSRRTNHGSRVILCLLSLPIAAMALNLVWLIPQMHRFTELLFQ